MLWMALVVAIIRIVVTGITWAFYDGSNYNLGILLGDIAILAGLIWAKKTIDKSVTM